MTITTLDTNTALIIVDLQTGILALPTIEPIPEISQRAGALAEAFRRHGLPVVLVNVDGGPATRTEQNPSGTALEMTADMTVFVAELNQQAGDHVVTKRTWGSFTNTGLEEHLRSLSVTQVVIVGVATSAGVESTARQSHEAGFNVTLAIDAMTDMSAEAHENSVLRIFPRIGETATTDEIITLLGLTRS